MKALLILLAGIAFASGAPSPAKEEEHNVEKRSPDDDFYFYPSRSFGLGTFPRTRAVTRTVGSSFQLPLRYFIDYDDFFDDRRKRQVPTNRQKRAADFDDDDFYWFPRTSIRRYSSLAPRPTVRSRFVRPVGSFFIDYDDFFDDRRKRQVTLADTKRQKRNADLDDDEQFVYYTFPATTYSVAPAVAPVTSAVARTAAVTPVQTIYYSMDDDDHDRKKRSADPDDDDDYHVVYTYTQPRTFVQTRTFVQPRTVVSSPFTYVTYDFDDKK